MISDAVYADLKYDDVFVLWLIVVCEWVCACCFVSGGLFCSMCLALLLRVVWVCEWCISSWVCIVFVLSVSISDEPSVWLHLIEVCCLFVTKVTNPNYCIIDQH